MGLRNLGYVGLLTMAGCSVAPEREYLEVQTPIVEAKRTEESNILTVLERLKMLNRRLGQFNKENKPIEKGLDYSLNSSKR